MQRIFVEDAIKRLPELFEDAINGETVVLVKNDNEEILLLPLSKPLKERPLGIGKGRFKTSDDFDEPLDDFKEYMP